MEPIPPLINRSKSKKSFKDVDAATDGNRFRELPEPVVHHIFSFLETMDVIRASAVSTSWRYLWTSMPHLKFSYKDFSLNPLYRGLHSCTVYEKFKDFINWVLMTHDKSVSIRSCRLACLNNDHSVYRWLHILAQKHVQELYLDIGYLNVSDRENPFSLPCCLLASDSLEVLRLQLASCVLEIPSCAGFSRLKSLELVGTQLLDQNLFQNFILNCPLLENLSLCACEFHDKALDISSTNLRKLIICTDCWDLGGFRNCDLKIACPNLVYFDLTGCLAQSFSWDKNTSFLRTVNIFAECYYDSVWNDELVDFVLGILREISHVEDLKLHMNILKYVSPAVAKAGCVTIFPNLKALRLSTCMNLSYIQSILYLLKCAPNLQLLSVLIDYEKRYERDYTWKMLDEDIACLKCHLKMVKLIDIDTMDDELELIRYFLKNGHVLEKMSIFWQENVKWETQRAAIQKVMKFPRSSSNVNVMFSELKNWGTFEL